jgi:hypothetical protein
MGKKMMPTDALQPSDNGSAPEPTTVEPPGSTEDLVKASRFRDALPQAPEVTKRPARVQITKPKSQQFVRVRPGPDWVHEALILEYMRDRRLYLDISGDETLGQELRARKWAKIERLYTAIDHYGSVFLWRVPLHDLQGNMSEWSLSAIDAAEEAETLWVQVVSNTPQGYYDRYTSETFGEPVWPDLSLNQLLHLAFDTRLIRSAQDPLLDELRGRGHVASP